MSLLCDLERNQVEKSEHLVRGSGLDPETKKVSSIRSWGPALATCFGVLALGAALFGISRIKTAEVTQTPSLAMTNPAHSSPLTGYVTAEATQTPSLTMATSSPSELAYYHEYSYYYYWNELISYHFSYWIAANPLPFSYYYTSYLVQLVNYHYFYWFYYLSMPTQNSVLSLTNLQCIIDGFPCQVGVSCPYCCNGYLSYQLTYNHTSNIAACGMYLTNLSAQTPALNSTPSSLANPSTETPAMNSTPSSLSNPSTQTPAMNSTPSSLSNLPGQNSSTPQCWADGVPCKVGSSCKYCCDGYASHVPAYNQTSIGTFCGMQLGSPNINVTNATEPECKNITVPPGQDPRPGYKGPGFKIRNDTPWPVEISLEMDGPLPNYHRVIQPGQYYFQETGGVWFTVKAVIRPDGQGQITPFDTWMPIAEHIMTAAMIVGTAGTAAPAAIPAAVLVGGVARTFSERAIVLIGSRLVGMGMRAGTALRIATRGVTLTEEIVKKLPKYAKLTEEELKGAIDEDALEVKETGVYAGLPFPPQTMQTFKITGGPNIINYLLDGGECVPVLQSTPLKLERPCLDDGIPCTHGASCKDCCNADSFWPDKFLQSCGQMPCYEDGTVCAWGTTCKSCCNGSHYRVWPPAGLCGP